MRVLAGWVPVAFTTGFLFAMLAAELAVSSRNEEIHVTAPKLHFIAGSSLERLKYGGTVPYDFQLQVWNSSRTAPLGRALERFVVSYDLWEEKYSVTKLRGSPTARENKSVSHLSAPAAESWCVDNISLPIAGLPSAQPLYVRLEIRSAEARQGRALLDESGVSLTRLIEIFSHPARPEQQRWTLEAGPLRLSDLQRTADGS